MRKKHPHVYPVDRARGLENRLRKWIQNPYKILTPYVAAGMTVLDLGCGPGFFTLELARMVGESGRIIACDLQTGMLDILRDKIKTSHLEQRIKLHKCEVDQIGLAIQVDFALLFYVVHEIPDKQKLFLQLAALVRSKGQALIVEPPLHVSKKAFAKTLKHARDAGFTHHPGPKLLFHKTAILKKS